MLLLLYHIPTPKATRRFEVSKNNAADHSIRRAQYLRPMPEVLGNHDYFVSVALKNFAFSTSFAYVPLTVSEPTIVTVPL